LPRQALQWTPKDYGERTPGEEISRTKWEQQDTNYSWRWKRKTELYGDKWFVSYVLLGANS